MTSEPAFGILFANDAGRSHPEKISFSYRNFTALSVDSFKKEVYSSLYLFMQQEDPLDSIHPSSAV
jgi:hypothetical protein